MPYLSGRVSTGSTQSEIISGVNPIKKKKGLKSLLKGLGRSKSIEDSDTAQTIAGAGLQVGPSDFFILFIYLFPISRMCRRDDIHSNSDRRS